MRQNVSDIIDICLHMFAHNIDTITIIATDDQVVEVCRLTGWLYYKADDSLACYRTLNSSGYVNSKIVACGGFGSAISANHSVYMLTRADGL